MRRAVTRTRRSSRMRRAWTAALAAALLVSTVGSALAVEPAASPATADASSADPTGRWIVVLKSGTNAATKSKDEGRKLGFKVDRTFGHAFGGFSARLDRGQVAALRRDPSVAMIVPDEKIQAEAQAIPTGISRAGATRSA